MERVENQDAALAALLAEHNHRYMFAAKYATGHVVDCACGIGYGHAFFQGNQVATYLGLDQIGRASCRERVYSSV